MTTSLPVSSGGTSLKTNYAGCTICDSTWGNLWEEVEGERRFFCCQICLTQFLRLLARLKGETGWASIDEIEIRGDRGGRSFLARSGDATFRANVRFTPAGELLRLERLPSG
jgi:hypothetical protein